MVDYSCSLTKLEDSRAIEYAVYSGCMWTPRGYSYISIFLAPGGPLGFPLSFAVVRELEYLKNEESWVCNNRCKMLEKVSTLAMNNKK